LSPESTSSLADEFNNAAINALLQNPPKVAQARAYLVGVRYLDTVSGRTLRKKSIALYNLAELEEQDSDANTAITTYREAIALDDANFEARYALGSFLLIRFPDDPNRLDEAVDQAHTGWEKYIEPT